MNNEPRRIEIGPYVEAGKVLSAFHASTASVRLIMGPYGSGKSSASVVEMVRRMMAQRAWNNVRDTEWAIVRSTYPELEKTTLKTFLNWLPEIDAFADSGYSLRITRDAPITARLRMRLPDMTEVKATFTFLALDRPDDVSKLASLELTGAWVNEVRFVPWQFITGLWDRCKRWPPKKFGGYTWTGLIGDTNPPMVDSDYYRNAEYVKPRGWAFFKQPPALLKVTDRDGKVAYIPNTGQNPDIPPAENITNLQAGYDYYLDMVNANDDEFIKVHVLGEYGVSQRGQAVYTAYNDGYHCAAADLETLRGLPLYLGWDYGHNQSVVMAQYAPWGQLRVIDEMMAGLSREDLKMLPNDRYFPFLGLREFVNNRVKPYLAAHYHDMRIISVGDPSGTTRSETDNTSCMQILEEAGIPTKLAASTVYTTRLEAVRWFLNWSPDKGQAGLLVSPRCRMLRRGFQSDYRYDETKTGTGVVLRPEPGKSISSHPHDALQYIAMECRQNVATGNAMDDPMGKRGARRQFRVAKPV
jgi:hypothetical protein